MKSRSFFLTFSLLGLLFYTQPGESLEHVRATWLWTPETIVDQPDEVLALCSETNINTLYVRVGYDYTISDKEAFKQFNKRANAFGIKVYATEGHPDWGLVPDHPDALSYIQEILYFNREVQQVERFAGIQLDIEPYDTPQFHEDKRYFTGVWIQNFHNFHTLVKQSGETLKLGGAFPDWLGQYSLAPTPEKFSGKTADQIFLDMLDFYVIMSYRDTVSGRGKPELPGSIESLSDKILNYAQNHKVIVAIETIEKLHDGTPLNEAITFYQEGPAAIYKALSTIEEQYTHRPGFGGIAVHEYHQWKSFNNHQAIR